MKEEDLVDEDLLRTLLMQQSSQLNILSENLEFNKTENTRQLNFNKTKKQKKSNTQSVDFFTQNG